MKHKAFALLVFCVAASAANAQTPGWLPHGLVLEAGIGQDTTRTATVGLIWPWSWRREFAGGEVTGMTEAFLSHWSARSGDGRRSFTQIGAVVPLLRYRFSQGRSPWFAEAGIGFSVMDPVYRTERKEFSTHFNFVDVLGMGRSFGERGQHELGLRLTHVSNGGMKHPNPGENLLQVRYALMF